MVTMSNIQRVSNGGRRRFTWSRGVSRDNMLLLGVIQMVVGVLVVASSFSAFFLSNFPPAIHNTSPYWAGLSGLLCGAVGIIAWRHNSMFTTTFYALLSSLCIVLNLLGAVLTSKISQNLAPIHNCPCFCCTTAEGCAAYFTPQQETPHGFLAGVSKLHNRTSPGGLGGSNSITYNGHVIDHSSSSSSQYTKPLSNCDRETATLRSLMIVLCIENSLACGVATLSTIVSLLLIAKTKTPIGLNNNNTNSNAISSEANARGVQITGDPETDSHRALALQNLEDFGAGMALTGSCPWVLWHTDLQALLPPPYLPPPYTTSDNPNYLGAPFVLLNGPGFEFSWETDSLPPPYSSCDIVTTCRIRGASPEVTTTTTTSMPREENVENAAASCSSGLSLGATFKVQKVSAKPWCCADQKHRHLRPSKSVESFARVQRRKFRSTHYLFHCHPNCLNNCNKSKTTTDSIVFLCRQNKTKTERRFGSDGALHRVGFWHELSEGNRKFKSVSILSGNGSAAHIQSTTRNCPTGSLIGHEFMNFSRQNPTSSQILMTTDSFLFDSSRALQSLSNQIANAGVSALEKLVTIKNQLTSSLKPSQAASCYSELVNERIKEETTSQIIFEDMESDFLLQDLQERQPEVLLKNEVPQEDCSYIIEVPPMAASSSDEESLMDEHLIRGTATVVELHHEEMGLGATLAATVGANGLASPVGGSKESGLSEIVFYDTETSLENMAHGSSGRELGNYYVTDNHSGYSREFGCGKLMEKQKSTSAESLPPSRYDYPAFLTIPRSRKDHVSYCQQSDIDDAMETSVEDVSLEAETPHILSSSSEELLSFESDISVKPKVPVSISRHDNLVQPKSTSRVPECFDDSPESTGPSYASSRPRDTTSFLRTSRVITRRFSSGDDKPRCQQRTRRYNSASSSSTADYEDGLYLVSSREQEYIRKHTIRNESRDDPSMTGSGEGSNESNYHSAADVYVSLLNIIQQSQSLITDLTLHYQAEMTFSGSQSRTGEQPQPPRSNDSSACGAPYRDSYPGNQLTRGDFARGDGARALETTPIAADSVLRNYEYRGKVLSRGNYSRPVAGVTSSRGAEGSAIGVLEGPGWTTGHNYWAPGNPGTSYDVKESFV